MSQATLFLKTKLLPPIEGAGQLDRPRLTDRLAAGMDRSATLIQAGPGYGKTTLAARFLAGRSEPSVWLRLDDSDTDPWMVLRYLIEGLKKHRPEFARESAGLWDLLRERDEPVQRLADVFIRDAEEGLSDRAIVVLDGTENLAAAPETQRMLSRLLDYLPGTLHLILVGRPVVEVALKAPPRLVNRIQPDELRLSLEETRELLVDCWETELDADSIERIHVRTRGWITALQLLVRATGLGPAGDVPADIFDRAENEVFDYFSESVLQSVRSDTRELLLAASLPKAFSAALLEEVLEIDRAPAIVEGLVQQRLFTTPLSGDRDLFEFDPLFRDFLQKKLRASRPAQAVREIERRFGEALDRQGQAALALEHLIASEDGDAIAGSLIRSGRRLLHDGFLDLVRRAADAALAGGATHPLVRGMLGEVSRLRGDYGMAIGHFEVALRPDASPVLSGSQRASALQGLAHSRLKLGEVEVAEATAREALTEAGEDHALTARVLNSLAVALYRRGNLNEAIENWQEALVRSRRGGEEDLTLMIAHNLGLPHAMMGDFDRASECFRMLTDPELGRLGPETGAAMLNLARIATLRGDYRSAARLLDDAWELSRKWGLRSLAADVLEAQGTLLRESGELAAAQEKYGLARSQFTELGLIDLVSNVEEEEAILAARLGDHERADRLASDLVARATAAGDEDSRASAQLALGEIRAAHGDPGSAAETLVEVRAFFRGRNQAYQQCVGEFWAALAALRGGDATEAERAAGEALKLSGRYKYDQVLRRLAGPHAELSALLGRQPACSATLRQELGVARPTESVALGAVSPSGVDLRICLLGPVEVFRDQDRKIPDNAWKLKRALKVFCYLSAARGQRANKERVVEAVWGDATPAAVEKNFHPTISFLRKALNHGHSASKNFILYEAGAYRLNPEYRYALDTDIFENSIRKARQRAEQHDVPAALERYDSALSLRRGEFLDDLYEGWAEGHRRHYETLYREALREAGELHLGAGNLERCVDYLRRLVEHDPTDEQVSVHLMMALGALGRRSDVEREYQRLSGALEAQLAASPSPATRKAYRHAMTADAN